MLGGDGAHAAPHLAEDVELVSPLTDRFAFRGRDSVAAVLADASTVMDDLEYTETFAAGDRIVLRAEALVRGSRLEELVLLQLDDAGLIAELAVFVRPFTGATALLRALTPLVARREGGRAAAFGAARLGGSLAAGARLADAAGANLMKDSPGIAADRS